MVMASTSELMRPLKRSTMPLVCGVRGLVWRYCAPSSAQAAAKAWVKQLPLSVNTCVMRKGSADAASRRKAMALASVSSSLTARWTARAAIDGDVEIALAPFTIGGLQLGQVLDVDVHEAKVVVLVGTLALDGVWRCRLGPTVQPLGLEDAPDAVAVEMRQEMGDDKRQVIEREVGHPAQRADNGALLLGGLPGQLVRPRRVVQAVCRTPLAPLADGLGGHAVALGEEAGALAGAGDLGAGDGRDASVRMDLQHRSDLPLSGLDQTFKQVAIPDNSMPHRVPTMFRDLTRTGIATRQRREPGRRQPGNCLLKDG